LFLIDRTDWPPLATRGIALPPLGIALRLVIALPPLGIALVIALPPLGIALAYLTSRLKAGLDKEVTFPFPPVPPPPASAGFDSCFAKQYRIKAPTQREAVATRIKEKAVKKRENPSELQIINEKGFDPGRGGGRVERRVERTWPYAGYNCFSLRLHFIFN
jgi:hypothetical protein